MDTLAGRKIAFLTANEGVEQVELTAPWAAVQEAGGTPRLLAPETGTVQAYNHLEKADAFSVDEVVGQASAEDFAGLVLPGGVANPDRLRTDPRAVALVKSFFDAGIPVAVICHGPWTLIEADVVRNRTLTSWPSLRTDLGNAGAHWVEEEVVTCNKGANVLISSRKPDDLKAFCTELLAQFAAHR